MSQYFPPYKSFRESIRVNLNLSNYATKTDLRNITHIDVSNFASKANLASLKTEVYKLDINKLTRVHNDLAKLRNVVKNDVVKKDKYDKLVGKVDNSALIAVENKIPDDSILVKKTDYNKKISHIEKKIIDHNHDKYITTPEFNILAADVFNAKLAAQTDLIRKPEFDFELKGISDRVTKNKTKDLLVESEL